MSQVGVWNGVDTGAARVETEERKSQNANYMRDAQRHNVMMAFNGPSLGL
jgi:hypothetical protein